MSWSDLYRGESDLDFRRVWRVGIFISAFLLLAGVGALIGRGLNLGIDFEGGTAWEYRATQTVADVRAVMDEEDEADAKIQIVGDDTVRIQSATDDPQKVSAVTAALAEEAGISINDINVSVVGPSWGEEISRSALRALAVFFVVIAVYLWLRLEWKMAVGALVAVVHDIAITVGVYAIFGFEVTPATVISFLTILGYSLYDTIVVYDRVKENATRYVSGGRLTYMQVMNLSMNQVLMRSVNTTLASILPVLSLLLIGSVALGAKPLQEFGIALFVGLTIGAYSTLFVASPLVVVMKEREPRWRQIRARLEARGEVAEVSPQGDPSDASEPQPAHTGPYTHPPRPRTGRGRSRRR